MVDTEQGKDREERHERDLRKRAEKVFKRKGPEDDMTLTDRDALIHELEVHQIELEMQNEELQRAHRELQESRDRFADLFDFAPVGYFVMDKYFRVQEANLKGCHMLGVVRSRLLGTRLTHYIVRGDQDKFYQYMRASLVGGEHCDVRMRREGGELFYAELEIRQDLSSDTPLRYRVTVTDITERQEAEKRLIIKDQAIASSPTGIGIADLDGNLTYVNPALVNLGGYREDEVLGKSVYLFFEEEEETKRSLEAVIKDGSWRGDLKVRRRDGSFIDAQLLANLVYDEKGTPLCLMVSLIDVTDLKEAGRRMRESEKRARQRAEELQTLMDLAPVAISISTDPEGRDVIGNKTAKAFLTATEMENVSAGTDRGGKSDAFTRRFFKGGRELKPEEFPMQAAARGGIEINDFEMDVLTPSGSLVTILGNARPLFTEDGAVRGAIGAFIDITERKKTEHIKDEFIGMVSHEIRTPLTVIIGALATAIAEGLSPEEQRELIRDAISNADILNMIVDNLLELSRSQSNRLLLHKEAVDVEKTAGGVANSVRDKLSVHRLKIDFPSGTAPVDVDRLRLERVLRNLVDNAIKYSPEGGNIRIFGKRGSGEMVIGVSDQGRGISAEEQTKLFQKFERIGTVENSSIQGIGLGLSVCRILVEAHGGRIWVESEEGKGSTFFFTIPLSSNAEGPARK